MAIRESEDGDAGDDDAVEYIRRSRYGGRRGASDRRGPETESRDVDL